MDATAIGLERSGKLASLIDFDLVIMSDYELNWSQTRWLLAGRHTDHLA
jgi:hypothetical protein